MTGLPLDRLVEPYRYMEWAHAAARSVALAHEPAPAPRGHGTLAAT